MPKFKMLIGLPASGKSTYAKSLAASETGWIHLSSDEIARNNFGAPEEFDHRKIFEMMYERTVIALEAGSNVIYDATNLSSSRRRSFLNRIAGFPADKEAVLFLTPYEVLKKRNSLRSGWERVPSPIIERYIRSFQFPRKDEGFQQITPLASSPIELPEPADEIRRRILSSHNTSADFKGLLRLFGATRPIAEQEDLNPAFLDAYQLYQALHCDPVIEDDKELFCWVALLFSTGKSYVRKGLPIEEDNFYGYEHVSSYLAYPILSAMDFPTDFIHDALLLIDEHREAPSMKRGKVKRRIGHENYERLQVLLRHLVQ